MGFGKTAAVTTAIEKLFRLGEVRRVLIVTTLRVATNTWPDEIQDWAHTSYLKFAVLTGDAGTRLAAARGPEQIHIINQENFVWLVYKAGRSWPYDTVVFDDAEGLRSARRKSPPAQAICVHRKDCPLFLTEKSGICALSIPPGRCPDYRPMTYSDVCAVRCEAFEQIPNRLQACITLCEDFKAPPARYTRFGALCALAPQIKRLVHLTGTPSNKALLDLWPLVFTLDGGWDLKPRAEAGIHEAIKDICIAVESEAVLPECHHINELVTLPPEAARLYREFERDLIVEIDDEEIEAANNGVLAGKLLQICGGAVYTGEDREWVELHDEKFKRLDAILEKHAGEPVLIGYNLQKGPGRVLVWFGLNWRLDYNKQLNKRLWRPGQAQEVFIYYLITEGRADVRLMEGVAKYEWTQNQLLEAVKLDAAERGEK